MSQRPQIRRLGAVVVGCMAGTLLAGCIGPDGDDAATAEPTLAPPPVIASVAPPPERSSPFCVGMSDLYEQLDAESNDDETATIAAAYTALLPTVPVEIVADFRQVISDLEAGAETFTLPSVPSTALASAPLSAAPNTASDTAPSTTAEVFEEGYDPDDTAAGRVNAYIQFACTSIENNPGPSATQPEAPPDSEP